MKQHEYLELIQHCDKRIIKCEKYKFSVHLTMCIYLLSCFTW